MTGLSEIKQHFTILGAGVVGLCCAVSLQREGFDVTLVDRLDPGTGTSFGNAGLIQIDSVVPIATPGIMRAVPSMLLDPMGPLVVRWRYLHRIAPWLLKFALNARPDKVEQISFALASLLDRSNDAWLELITAANAGDIWRQSGELHVYRTREAWEKSRLSDELRRRRGSKLEELSVEEMRQLEPSLSPKLHRGVFTPNANSITHPFHLSQRLFELFRRNGGKFVKVNVTGIERREDGEPCRLLTDGAYLPIGGLVIAAGAFSKPFVKSVGASVPLETERGYHLWLPNPGIEMRRPIIVGDHKFGIVPMTGGIRLVGTVEFGGLDLAPDWRRADVLAKLSKPFVPDLNLKGAERWMGYRPSMPDSLPVIGRLPGRRNLYLAFGHGHLGLTMAAVTGEIIAGLARGKKINFDLSPFSPERF